MPKKEMLALTVLTLLGAATGCKVDNPTPTSVPIKRTPTTIIYNYDCKEGRAVPPAAHPWVYNDRLRYYEEISWMQFQRNRDRSLPVVAFDSDYFIGYALGKDGIAVKASFCQTDLDLFGPNDEVVGTYWRVN